MGRKLNSIRDKFFELICQKDQGLVIITLIKSKQLFTRVLTNNIAQIFFKTVQDTLNVGSFLSLTTVALPFSEGRRNIFLVDGYCAVIQEFLLHALSYKG